MKKVLIVVAMGFFYFASLGAVGVLAFVAGVNQVEPQPTQQIIVGETQQPKRITEDDIADLYELVNEYRLAYDLPELKISDKLERSSKMKAIDLVSLGYWSHEAPDGQQPWELFKFVSYSYSYAGENLAKDYTNVNDAMSAWKSSPGHNENLMRKIYTEHGIGYACDPKGGCVIVHHFGRP